MADKMKLGAMATLLFVFCGFVIEVVALSFLQAWCNGSDNVCGFATNAGTDSQVFSYWWWITCAQFVVLLIYAGFIASGLIHTFKTAIIAMLTILAVKFMDFADEALHHYWNNHRLGELGNGDLQARLQAFVAGACFLFIANVFLIFMTAALDDHTVAAPAPVATPPQVSQTKEMKETP